MHKLDIIDLLLEAVDTFLPTIVEEDRRRKALTVLRGCGALLALQSEKASPVYAYHRASPRAERAIFRARCSAIADAAKYLQHECDNFGRCHPRE